MKILICLLAVFAMFFCRDYQDEAVAIVEEEMDQTATAAAKKLTDNEKTVMWFQHYQKKVENSGNYIQELFGELHRKDEEQKRQEAEEEVTNNEPLYCQMDSKCRFEVLKIKNEIKKLHYEIEKLQNDKYALEIKLKQRIGKMKFWEFCYEYTDLKCTKG